MFGKKKKEKRISYEDYPHLLELKPNDSYIFHSDYFICDNQYGCVLSFFHSDASKDNFAAFWGVNLIPSGLPDTVTIILFEQNRKMSTRWIESHQTKSEKLAEMDQNEQYRSGTNTTFGSAVKKTTDLQIIASEIIDGASYINSHYRLLVTAPSLYTLDEARKAIDRLYIDRFATVSVAAYHGLQRYELSNLFKKNSIKNGKGFYFTSVEKAGTYNLVTHGLEDKAGEYIGQMIGDVNTSAILFDIDGYSHHVVVANNNINSAYNRAFVSDMWGSKISQSALMRNHRVVHLILNGANLDELGPKFENITSKIDMTTGDVNMFEIFGEEKEELSLFAYHMMKLRLMAEQMYTTNDNDRAIIRGSLEDVATKFYIDSRMWHENASYNRDKLRVVNIPHNEVPKLEKFVAYLETEHKRALNTSLDMELSHAINVLKMTFRNMLTTNGDLFNTSTSDKIDNVKTGRRVIYDFSALMTRGSNIAMAQLVNIAGFAVGNLQYGDVVIIHGVEYIDESVKEYINIQLEKLIKKGGRVAYLYSDTEKMLNDFEFNKLDQCDYSVLGAMPINTIEHYQNVMGQEIPHDLKNLISKKNEDLCYIRRNHDNVVFRQELFLGR